MTGTWRSSLMLRKARRYGAVPLRAAANARSKGNQSRPPILANSVPKSGTHLLIQVLQVLPRTRDWGLFLADTPSFRFRQVPAKTLARRVLKMADGELAGAHLACHEAVRDAINNRGAVHYLIYRDPRDVVISEAHYLTHMNHWHRLHRHFRVLPNEQSRIRLAIEGLPTESGLSYPPIGERYAGFLGWLEDPGTCTVRYEALAGPDRQSEVDRIIAHWCDASGYRRSPGALASAARDAINPESSHTFRRGQVGGWREVMDATTEACFYRHASGLLEQLGYVDDK